MKLVISIEQETDTSTPPKVTISVDDKPLGLLQRVELDVGVDHLLPRLRIQFIDFSKLLAASFPADASVDAMRTAVATWKKVLQQVRWIDVS